MNNTYIFFYLCHDYLCHVVDHTFQKALKAAGLKRNKVFVKNSVTNIFIIVIKYL